MNIPKAPCWYGLAALAIGLLPSLMGSTPAYGQSDLLPDLFFEETAPLDNEIDTTTLPGQVLFRFDSSIPNLGPGEFRVQTTGVIADPETGMEEVEQRITRDDMTTYTVPVSNFQYDPVTTKMFVMGWVAYRIREVLPGGGVGAILAEGAKPKVNITSSAVYDSGLPNYPGFGNQLIASNGVHGISVGFTDLYPKFLEFQWIDVTGLPSDDYWLELEIDPAGTIMEEDETNNVTQIMVNLDFPDDDGDGLADTFEEAIGTSPTDQDSDNDGLTDDEEVGYDGDTTDYNPFDPDTNPTGTDLNALVADTDGDGVSDRQEITFNTDPINPGDVPTLPACGGRNLSIAALAMALVGLVAFRREPAA